ncbi:MAG: hypothetical protein PHG54_04985 [Smithellaceae bacterium]|nr:hypothetical protein [Syntrophaceae bacterium]MDD4240766.1 hypothetical protein [Smithellaceae bacterium]
MKQIKFFLLIFCCLAAPFSIPAAFSEPPAPEDPRVKQCLVCCEGKQRACYNISADRRQCAVAYQACVDNCLSEGNTVAEWSDCWSTARP